MKSSIKSIVKERYSKIARTAKSGIESACCDTSCCSDEEAIVTKNKKAEDAGFSISLDYKKLDGYLAEADLGLGCGLPTEVAGIKKGDTVVDMGSGAGNDCFIAYSETGETGKVIGVDFSADMIKLAKKNAEKRGIGAGISFIESDIESTPLPDKSVDVVVSNCVFNLVPDKLQAYKETFRILKDSGHFSISDIVYEGEIPEVIKNDPGLLVECVSGAMEKQNYLDTIKEAGFTNTTIKKTTEIKIPKDLLAEYGVTDPAFKLYSITINGSKQLNNTEKSSLGCC